VVQTLAKAIDAKDTYTNGHSDRVANYSREIAKRLGYSEKEHDEMYMIVLLHDVGKIGVPDQIINKTDRLTDEEFELSISDLVNFYVNEFVPEKDKPAVEMTLSEVEKALGHKVKIVEEELKPWE
jgi:hypothetical protein